MRGSIHFRFVAETLSPGLWREVSALTDHASVRIAGVVYREATREVIVPISRVPFSVEPGVFRESRRYDSGARVESEIRIGRVVTCRVENRCESTQEVVTLERGLTAEGPRLSLNSVDESRGVTCFAVEIEVDGIDITIADASP